MKNLSSYLSLFKDIPKPFAFVDQDIFDQNLQQLVQRTGDKDIRVATKSIRCVRLLEQIRSKANIKRWMCFTLAEALFLSSKGFDNLLVAYPSFVEKDLIEIGQKVSEGKKIYITVDLPHHIETLSALAQKHDITFLVSLDMDVSLDFMGIHFGVYRSSITSIDKMREMIQLIKQKPYIHLKGVMTYDAQIAGVADKAKGNPLNPVIRFLKKKSLPKIKKIHQEIAQCLTEQGIQLDFLNAGGTGSLEHHRDSKVVTELTFGSGLFAPTLFDDYRLFEHQASAGFVLEVSRNPSKNIYTALGGGYIASGSVGTDRQPSFVFPRDAKTIKNEGFGEVQTPFESHEIQLDDTNFAILRHAKAGELCERFEQLLVISGGEVVDRFKTYRGEGQTFL